MLSSLPLPDLLVYLHSDVPRLQENIHKRGREFELNIKDAYLKSIQNNYFDYLKFDTSRRNSTVQTAVYIFCPHHDNLI